MRLRREDGTLIAAVDGALLDGAHDLMAARGLDPVALYLDLETKADLPTGPHMAVLRDGAARDRLLGIPRIAEAAVFWSVPGHDTVTDAAAYAHLRSLTMVRTPLQADANRGRADRAETETLFFRYGDPNVMARVFPCLTGAQRTRLMGPAKALVFLAQFGGGVRHFLNESIAEVPDRRMLRLSQAQYDRIIDGYRETLLARAIETFSPALDPSEKWPEQRITDAFERAEAYGVREQEGIFEFIAADLAHGHRFEKSARFALVRDILAQTDTPGDLKIAMMRTEIAQTVRGRSPW